MSEELELDGELRPCAPALEESILGTILAYPDTLCRVSDTLTPDDFTGHRAAIYKTILELSSDGGYPDALSVSMQLSGKQLEGMPALQYLNQLLLDASTPLFLEQHCRLVQDRAKRRRYMRKQPEMQEAVLTAPTYAHAQETVNQLLQDIAGKDENTSDTELSKLAVRVLQLMEERYNNGGELPGIPTGLQDLDRAVLGWKPGELIVLAGRPAMGKTALALTFALNCALSCEKSQERRRAVIFSLEMSKEALTERLYSNLSGINGQNIATGQLTKGDWIELSKATSQLDELPVTIFDQTDNVDTVLKMKAKLQQLIQRGSRPGLVLIDYLGYIIGTKAETKSLEIDQITRDLHNLSVELKVPIILLCQLSRAVEGRQDKRPTLSDLRDSGAIEQAGDVILLIYRDEYYNPNGDDKGTCEIIIAKQKNGPTGKVKVAYQATCGRFHHLDQSQSFTPKTSTATGKETRGYCAKA